MKYKVGMFGGSFDPLHVGHIHNIIKAASECDELYIIISWCEGRESTSKELRYRWILNSCKQFSNIKIKLVEDKAVSKEEYNTDYYWEKGAQDIKNIIKKPIDVVFCGDDYLGTNRFESLYCPESEVVYYKRSEVPISSTDIRAWAIKHWDYVPEICRPHYTSKVLVIGGESTGKSTLVKNLSLAYNTNFVSEVGRDTCEYAGGEEYMIAEDLYENLIKQKINTIDAIKRSNRILFVDTDALTTLFYADFLLTSDIEKEKCKNIAESIHAINGWDLVIFLEPTVAFVQDGTRNEDIAANREKYSRQIKKLLDRYDVEYHCIEGDYLSRFLESKRLISENLGIHTRW